MTDESRKNVFDWDASFMGDAFMTSFRSKDPSTQVGAVLVNSDHRIVSTGYNGTPKRMNDEDFPWGKDSDDPLETKYPYVIHAERNAILNTEGPLSELKDGTAYVTLFPCHECMKSLAQAGINRVVYYNGPRCNDIDSMATERIAMMCGITLEQYHPMGHTVTVLL